MPEPTLEHVLDLLASSTPEQVDKTMSWLKANIPDTYKRLSAYLKLNKGIFIERRGPEHWLKTLGAQTFTRPFAPIQRRFWEWNWGALNKVRNGVPLDPKETVGFLPWPRETGKSSHVEWAAIAEGAILKSGYVIYLSAKLSQAIDHVVAIRDRIESEHVAETYPWLGKPKLGAHGNKFGWGQEFLMTSGGWSIRPVGADVAMRGGKSINLRPSMVICHERGTRMLHESQWIKVEDHPTAKEHRSDGVEVQLHGLPFRETVSLDHRYKVISKRRTTVNGEKNVYVWTAPAWVKGSDLSEECYVGLPIDFSVKPLQPVLKDFSRKKIVGRDKKGRITKYENVGLERVVIEEFFDPDWWWLIGLWWGDGHLTKTQVGWTIATAEPEIFARVSSILRRWNKPYSVVPKSGCSQIVIAHTAMSRWLRTWKLSKKQGHKAPPAWVEKLNSVYQERLIQGYVAADGFIDIAGNGVRITSVSLEGLLALRRILLRFGICSSIRRGVGPGQIVIKGRTCQTQQKYDLRFRGGARSLGYPFDDQTRYDFVQYFIEDGWLWSKIRSLAPALDKVFVPIKTEDHTYVTAFGQSHNCDDYDELGDSPHVVEHKEHMLTRAILPMGNANTRVLVPQNPIHPNSVVNRMLTGASLALAIRTIFGEINEEGSLSARPIQAVKGLVYEVRQADEGPYSVITQGESNWPGITVSDWEGTMNRVSPDAFAAEYQHDMTVVKEERVLPEYDDRVLRLHVITWSQFEAKYKIRRIPRDWPCDVGLDIGYTVAHKSAWSFISKVPQAYELSGSIFRYRGRTFTGIGIDEQAVIIRSELWPEEKIEREYMSHEKLGERMVLNSKHDWHFNPFPDIGKFAGVAQWRHFLMSDHSQPHPFHPDRKGIDGRWELGRPAWFDVVDDRQFIAPVDDAGMKGHRDGAYNWRKVPVKLTDKGLTIEQPAKKDDDECFVAGTLITTARGEVPIEEIGQKDVVLTRQGWYSVLACGKTKSEAEIWTITLSSGSQLSGTKTHPIWVVGYGWKPLSEIRAGERLLSLTECASIATQSQSIGRTEPISSPTYTPFVRELVRYTSSFGSLFTEIFQKITRFITGTIIRLTTPIPILNYLPVPNIAAITGITCSLKLRRECAQILSASRNWQRSGIEATKEGSGTENTLTKAFSRHLKLKCNACTSFVKSFFRGVRGLVSFVRRSVSSAITTELFPHGDYVYSVIRRLKSEPRIASTYTAEVFVVSNQRIDELSTVYNLSVERHSEYFANGVLVHNCDSTRGILTGFGPSEQAMTQSQKIQQIIPAGYHKSELLLRNDIPPDVAHMTGEMADWLARRTLALRQPKAVDDYGQIIS
jgi:hypothetical protein